MTQSAVESKPIFIGKLPNASVRLPEAATPFSLCYDVYLPEPFTYCYRTSGPKRLATGQSDKIAVLPFSFGVGNIYKVNLGLKWHGQHDKRFGCQFMVRSSLAESMRILGGTIDGDYPDEWILKFETYDDFSLKVGSAIIQLDWRYAENAVGLERSKTPRSGGFGSTTPTPREEANPVGKIIENVMTDKLIKRG